VDPYLRSTPFIQVNQQNELGRSIRGHRAEHPQFLCRTSSAASTAATPKSPDIHEQIRARLAAVM
jgi:hypothetical protein